MENLQRSPLLSDAINVQILQALADNPRIPNAELARAVGMSGPSVRERVQRLEECGLIRGIRLDLDPKLLGYPVAVMVRIRPMPGQFKKLSNWHAVRLVLLSATGLQEKIALLCAFILRALMCSTMCWTHSCVSVKLRHQLSSPRQFRRDRCHFRTAPGRDRLRPDVGDFRIDRRRGQDRRNRSRAALSAAACYLGSE